METPSTISIQLLHLVGPFKGKTQNFTKSSILIGRYTDYDICFPDEDEWDIVSRDHAKIKREGTRFTLINYGVNGTTVSRVSEKIKLEKKGQETSLRDEDIITFADGGPKVRFLTEVTTENIPLDPPPVEIQFIISCGIQCDLKIRNFKKLPVVIGKNSKCDFQLNHPAIFDRHAQIFYCNKKFWIKDLTGKKVVMVQGTSINDENVFNLNDEIALSPRGPFFKFIEGNCLDKIEKYPSQEAWKVNSDHEDSSLEEICVQEREQKGKLSRIINNIWKP